MPIWSPAMIFGSASSGYVIEDSIWLDGSADYLHFTPGGAPTDGEAATLSFWVRRLEVNHGSPSDMIIESGNNATEQNGILFSATTSSPGADNLIWWTYGGSSAGSYTTDAKYRDVTAWSNFVLSWDWSASGLAKQRIWTNGVEVQDWYSRTESGNTFQIGANGKKISIGYDATSSTNAAHISLSEFILLDGTASTDASEFGELDGNGVWVPVDPSGLTFGDNGFWLDFAVAPGTGNGAGTDVSGNGNHFTEVSMTTAQQVTDTPTDDVDNDIGNYCTLNATDPLSHTLTEGNLKATAGASGRVNYGTIAIPTTGKWYWEAKVISQSPNQGAVGIKLLSSIVSTDTSFSAGSGGYGMFQANNSGLNGHYFENNNTTTPGGGAAQTTTWAVNDIVNIAYSADDGEIWFGKNNTYYSSFTNGTTTTVGGSSNFSSIPSGVYVPAVAGTNGGGTAAYLFNFGANAFSYTPPTGYKALNTANLPAPTVTDPDDGFVQVLNTGANIESALATARSGYSTYLEVFKDLDGSTAWQWRFSDDTSNGLDCESTAAKTTFVAPSGSNNFVGWSFNMNATHGMFTAEVSHSNGSDTNTAHSLGAGLKMAVVKITNTTGAWYWSHPGMTSGYNIEWNQHTTGEQNSTVYAGIDDTNVIVKSAAPDGTYRVIAIVEVAGFSGLPTMTGNGVAAGPFINMGMQPEFMMCRRHTGGTNTFSDCGRIKRLVRYRFQTERYQ